ncbi:MAG: hypothetical protein L0Y60_13615 [Beijerinckiaceae bacterium]|nr:hypothetical protein [Beijerinckiaceae bacterium]
MPSTNKTLKRPPGRTAAILITAAAIGIALLWLTAGSAAFADIGDWFADLFRYLGSRARGN